MKKFFLAFWLTAFTPVLFGQLIAPYQIAGPYLPTNAPKSTMGAYQFYSPTGEFDPVVFVAQALTAGTTCTTGNDSTAALQTALNTAQQLGGGIVRLHPGTYCISSPLSIGNGVLFRGSGNFSIAGGTIIQNSAGTAAFSMTGSGTTTPGGTLGAGRSFELSDLIINGSSTTDDCIDLLSGTSAPQNYKIANITCRNFGGRGIFMNSTSYGVLDRVTLSSTSSSSCLDIEKGSTLTEVSYFERVNTQGCGHGSAADGSPNAAVKIVGGSNLYFNEMDLNDSDEGIYIAGGAFSLSFTDTNIVRALNHGVNLNADTAYLGRISFKNTSIGSATSSALATFAYVYVHNSGSYHTFAADFRNTWPVNSTGGNFTAGLNVDGVSDVTFENWWQSNTSDGITGATGSLTELGYINTTQGYKINGNTVLPSTTTGYSGAGQIILGTNSVFNNSADSQNTPTIRAGSTADQVVGIKLSGYTGTEYWDIYKTAGNSFAVVDRQTSGLNRIAFSIGGQTQLASGGTGTFDINMTTGSGTGALRYGSGTTSSVFQVSSTGAVSASSFSGAGTGLTGTASALSIGGNAATATKLASNTLGCLDGYDHLPCTIYQSRQTGLTAAVPVTQILAAAPAGTYRACAYMSISTIDSGGATVALPLSFVDLNGLTRNGYGSTSSIAFASQNTSTSCSATLAVQNGSQISWQATISGSLTTGVYGVNITVERID